MREVYARVRAVSRAGQLGRRRRLGRGLTPSPNMQVAGDDGFRVLEPGCSAAVAPVARAARALRRRVDMPALWKAADGRNLLRVDVEPFLDDDPAWLELAVEPSILEAVSEYLGSVPVLRKIQMWISPFDEAAPDGGPGEHRYHCDWAGLRQIRTLVFADEVSLDHGPLTVIPARRSDEARRACRYSFDRDACTLEDDELFALVPPEEQRPLTGPAGSVALVDTSRCFHQGSRVLRPGRERLLVMYQYLPLAGFKVPGRFVRRAPFARHADAGHSETQRLVLGA